MRTVKDPDVRKLEILDGAIRLFARKGYDKTTTSDIANELHISQGLCYRYFPTKEAIYDAAIDRYAEEIFQGNLQNVRFDLPIKDLIDSMTDQASNWKEAEKGDESLYIIFHSENGQRLHNELFLKVADKIIPVVQKHLRQAKENGEISIENTDSAAIAGIYSWIGMFRTKELTDEQRMENMRQIWYRLLGNP